MTGMLGNSWHDGQGDMRITLPGASYTNAWGYVTNRGDDGTVSTALEFYLDGRTVPLELDDDLGAVWTYKVPADWNLTAVLDTAAHEIVLSEKYSDQVYVFYSQEQEGDPDVIDLDDDSDPYNDSLLRGRLKEVTTRQWREANESGWEYSYDNATGRLMEITTPGAQSYDIEYVYGSGGLADRLVQVVVSRAAAMVMQVEYAYFDSPSVTASSHAGSSGDLLQVKVTRKDSAGNDQVRYTQYRYYTGWTNYAYGGGVLDYSGTLKAVYEHSEIQQLLADSSLADPEDILELDDDEVASGANGATLDYASRWFEYCFEKDDEEDTAAIDTGWASGGSVENLHEKYGIELAQDVYTVNNYPEAHEMRVMAEHVGAASGCSSCGGGGSARITRRYHYVNVPQGGGSFEDGASLQWPLWYPQPLWNELPNDLNEVSLLVVEDTFAHDDPTNYPEEDYPHGRPLYRKIYGFNDFSRKLREVLIENPLEGGESQAPLRCWCWATTYVKADLNDDGYYDDVADKPHLKHRVAEYRLPSAYDVTTNADLSLFLDPYDDPKSTGPHSAYDNSDDEWDNDEAVLRANDGLIYVYGYDNDQGLRTDEWVKRGRNGTPHYVSATDWGDGSDDEPLDRVLAAYSYPTKTTTRGSGVVTTYQYDFWDADDTQIRTITTTTAAVPTTENGSNVATVTEQRFDEFGRLRWTKNGEGYVSYYSYSPFTGDLAYSAIDVNPTSLPGSADAFGNDVKWSPSTDGNAAGNAPTRGGGLPTALGLVSTVEFDPQGREFLRTDPGDAVHYTAYQTTSGDVDRVIRFPYWNSGTDQPRLPIQVAEADEFDRVVAQYSLAPNFALDLVNDAPVGLDAAVTTASCQTLTRFVYDEVGRLVETQRYHDTSGVDPFDNYYSSYVLYDAEGRTGATIQMAEEDSFQITATLFDVQGRPIERRIAVDDVVPDDYADLSGSLPGGYATISTTEYDGDGIGDGYVTKSRKYHTASVYTDTLFHRTFRGFLRGVERQYTSGSTADVTPYQAMDVDWLGRTTVDASYTTEPTWSTLVANEGDAAYVSSISSGRVDRTDTFYDVLGRVYRTEHYPGTSANKLQTNNYYDRNGRLVCTGDKYSAHTEYAYDGAGRQYQERTVIDVTSARYTGGAFQYRAPAPHPVIANMPGTGDDGIYAMTHIQFDVSGNEIGRHEFETNHLDVNGIDIDATDSYIRRTVYTWFDAADRATEVSDYGCGEGESWGIWSASALPSRPASAPTWTDAIVFGEYVHLTKYEYDSNGRRNSTEVGVRYNSSNTDTMTTKTFFDALGRRTFIAENHVDFIPPSSGISGGINNDQDRVTGWKYNGLNQVTDLTAYNSNSTAQLTKYYYEDPYDASLVTHTVYPDSSSTPSSGTDLVKREYNLDGSLQKLTDQRGVLHEYSYNNRRQLELDSVASLGSSGSVDGSILSIKRTYDAQGRLYEIYSYPNANGTGTELNCITHQYHTPTGLPWRVYQHHGARNFTSSSRILAQRDSSVDGSGIFTNGLRAPVLLYPNDAEFHSLYNDAGTYNGWVHDNSLADRLGRTAFLGFKPAGGGAALQVAYKYNGTDRLVGFDFGVPQLRQRLYSPLDGIEYVFLDQWARTKTSLSYDYTSGTDLIDAIDYHLDFFGNRLHRANIVTADRNEAYGYDGLMRLIKANSGEITTDASAKFRQKWTLDAVGNWTKFQQDGLPTYTTLADNDFADGTDLDQDRVHNKSNEIDVNDVDSDSPGASITAAGGQANWSDPVYDKAGNMTTMPQPAAPTSPFMLKYDAWNRLVSVVNPGIHATNPIAKYEYDGLNRRIVKELDPNADGTIVSADVRHYFYNHDWQVIEERVGADPATARVDAQYVWHPHYVDSLALRFWDSDQTGGPDTFHYYLQDANYNVTAVTDNTGAVVERYAYTPYGEATILDDDFSVDADQISDVANVYLYTGRERDPETGLQLNRNRFYASHLGRWLTRDPIGKIGEPFGSKLTKGFISNAQIEYSGGMNLYQYCTSIPVSHLDPTGLFDFGWPFNGQFCNNSDGPVLIWGGGGKGDDNFQVLQPGQCSDWWDDDADSVYDPDGDCWRKIPGAQTGQFGRGKNSDQMGFYTCSKSDFDTGGDGFRPLRCQKNDDGTPKRRNPPKKKCAELCGDDKACLEKCLSF